ncbi:MAG: glycosyltransferase [Luteitalea sp.]
MTYLVPIRSRRPVSEEFLAYLAYLMNTAVLADVIVIDGSDHGVFADFAWRHPSGVRHVPVAPDLATLANGKVAGALTGIRLASTAYVVVADDDVRYDAAGLVALQHALQDAELVRPQNYFDPLPWHACLDTARTLINRVTGGDWPGTFGVRRAVLERTGGYDGNVLFENLELVRTVRAAGGRESRPLQLFVRRLPPRTDHFWSQRVRQAYDEFARPARLLTWLSVIPVLALAARLHWLLFGGVLLAPLAVAEAGRRVGNGVRVFPLRATLAAPLWVLERGVCAWLAVAARVALGGVPYRGRVLSRAATPYRTLVSRHASAAGPGPLT